MEYHWAVMLDFVTHVLFTLMLATYYGLLVFRERRRKAGWRALAEKYQLQTESSARATPRIAPAPHIPGVFRKAELSNYLQGEINGVPVVAFDIRSGTFRFRPQSSGVGIQRLHLSVPTHETFSPQSRMAGHSSTRTASSVRLAL